MSEGKKFDAGKAPLVQGCLAYFPRALSAVANVSAYGAKKYAVPYSDKNWSRLPDGIARYTDGLGRHVLFESIDGPTDPESGHLHAAHAAWNALARLELLLTPASPPVSAIDDDFPFGSVKPATPRSEEW